MLGIIWGKEVIRVSLFLLDFWFKLEKSFKGFLILWIKMGGVGGYKFNFAYVVNLLR